MDLLCEPPWPVKLRLKLAAKIKLLTLIGLNLFYFWKNQSKIQLYEFQQVELNCFVNPEIVLAGKFN